MAFVGVEHLGVQAQRAQHAHTADAEDDLLAQSVFGIAAVQPVGDGRTLGAVAVDRGVEQVQPHPAHLHRPGRHGDRVARQVDDDPHTGVGDGEATRVEAREPLLLVAVGVQALAKVALGVQQAHRHQGHTQIAGGLEVIAGQHPEPTAVLGECLADAELGREVGHQVQR